jgi:hypothetical protein
MATSILLEHESSLQQPFAGFADVVQVLGVYAKTRYSIAQ